MASVLLHFLVGTAGALTAFLVLTRISGNTSFSTPFGVIFVGIACAALAHFMSPWATPVILLLYVLAGVNEHVQDQKTLKAARKSAERSGKE